MAHDKAVVWNQGIECPLLKECALRLEDGPSGMESPLGTAVAEKTPPSRTHIGVSDPWRQSGNTRQLQAVGVSIQPKVGARDPSSSRITYPSLTKSIQRLGGC